MCAHIQLFTKLCDAYTTHKCLYAHIPLCVNTHQKKNVNSLYEFNELHDVHIAFRRYAMKSVSM